jgi:hypothetical protein
MSVRRIQAKDDPVLRLLFVEESDAERPAKNLAKRGRRINAFAGSIVLLILGWFAWPYYSIYSLASAIRDGDSIALESDINWETVRQGLRADFNAMYLKSMTDQPNEMARGLGVLLGPTLINQVVEGYVTPQAIGNLIRTGKPTNLPANGSVSREGTESATPITANENRDKLDLSRIEYAFFSGNPFTFRVDVRPDKEAQLLGNTTLLFKWLGDWKLTKIILPIDEIGKLVAKPANDNLTQKVDQAAKPTAPPVRGPVVREVPQ